MKNNGERRFRSWALWLLYLKLVVGCGLTGANANNESEDVSFSLLSDSPSSSSFAFLYWGHTFPNSPWNTPQKQAVDCDIQNRGRTPPACHCPLGCTSESSRARLSFIRHPPLAVAGQSACGHQWHGRRKDRRLVHTVVRTHKHRLALIVRQVSDQSSHALPTMYTSAKHVEDNVKDREVALPFGLGRAEGPSRPVAVSK